MNESRSKPNPSGKSNESDEPVFAEYRSHFMEDIDEETLKACVGFSTNVDRGGHAFTSSELQEFRDIVRISKTNWPDKELHRLTDELVCMTGLDLFAYPKIPRSSHIRQINGQILKPIEKLLEELQKESFGRQTRIATSPLDGQLIDKAVSALKDLQSNVTSHTDHLRSLSRRGRSWDSWLKDEFVRSVDLLCAYLNAEFDPTRKVIDGKEDASQFRDAVYLLARPIRWADVTGSNAEFTGAIRAYVDFYNSKLRAAMKATRAGLSWEDPAVAKFIDRDWSTRSWRPAPPPRS